MCTKATTYRNLGMTTGHGGDCLLQLLADSFADAGFQTYIVDCECDRPSSGGKLRRHDRINDL